MVEVLHIQSYTASLQRPSCTNSEPMASSKSKAVLEKDIGVGSWEVEVEERLAYSRSQRVNARSSGGVSEPAIGRLEQ